MSLLHTSQILSMVFSFFIFLLDWAQLSSCLTLFLLNYPQLLSFTRNSCQAGTKTQASLLQIKFFNFLFSTTLKNHQNEKNVLGYHCYVVRNQLFWNQYVNAQWDADLLYSILPLSQPHWNWLDLQFIPRVTGSLCSVIWLLILNASMLIEDL